VLRIVNGSKIYGGVHAIEAAISTLSRRVSRAGRETAPAIDACRRSPAPFVSPRRLFRRRQPVDFEQPRGRAEGRHLHGVSGDEPGSHHDRGAEHRTRKREAFDALSHPEHPGPAAPAVVNFHCRSGDAVALLGTAKKQMVEIARAIYNKARIIIFDERPPSLTPEEIVHFFHWCATCARGASSIIYTRMR